MSEAGLRQTILFELTQQVMAPRAIRPALLPSTIVLLMYTNHCD
jgi:hypothetical protein